MCATVHVTEPVIVLFLLELVQIKSEAQSMIKQPIYYLLVLSMRSEYKYLQHLEVEIIDQITILFIMSNLFLQPA